MAAYGGAHGLKDHKTEDHFKPADLKHTDFSHKIKKPGMNQTPGNGDSKKKFTKEHPLVDPAHKGECTPMSKPTCTGHKLAFAKRVKREHGFH